jgi:hypothetical protein
VTASARRVVPIIIALAVAGLCPVAARADDEVVIEAGALRPPVLQTTTAHRVTFVNRSGRLVHVEFTGDPGEHRVFQVPGQIWAVFHRPGRHPYVVHVGTGRNVVTLAGAVEVRSDPNAPPELPTCDSTTFHGRTITEPCIAW